ncbi:MAG: hypothetical protein JST50_14840 [Bacteroidetes bacterium]|jgi:hypothetical protein|nr:hypothetical protein [Bacteroidota bacterium]
MTPIFTFPDCSEQLALFQSFYDNPVAMIAEEGIVNQLKAQAERTCRYCNKSEPETTFKKEAHIISQMLGKNDLLCDFECDACNQIFSKYESSFVNWLGITRTLIGTRGRRNKVPEYLSGTGNIQAKLNTIMEADGVIVSRTPDAHEAINIDVDSGKTTIQYAKRAYIPLEVYKVLLKIAFAVLPTEDVADYAPVLRMLTAEAHPDLCRFAHIMRFQLPLDQSVTSPYGILFTKRDPLAHCPRHSFIFYYANQVYSFPLPFSIQDIRNGCYTNIKCYFPPPIFFDQPLSFNHVNVDRLPMGSLEKVKGEREIITFEFKPKDLENLMSFDPVTGESKPHTFDPKDILSIFMVRSGRKLKLSKK